MADYANPTVQDKPDPPLTSTELLELVAVRDDLTSLIDFFVLVVNWFFDGGMPATYLSQNEISDLVGDLILRRHHLAHHASQVEQLAAEQ